MFIGAVHPRWAQLVVVDIVKHVTPAETEQTIKPVMLNDVNKISRARVEGGGPQVASIDLNVNLRCKMRKNVCNEEIKSTGTL